MGSSSLDFIKPTREIPAKLTQPPPPQPPVASVAEIKTAPPVTVKTVPARAAKTKKIFMTPKLKPSRGFTKMGGASNPDPTGTNAPPPGMNPQDLMKNLPPEAANNPQLQQILKQQGK